MDGCNKQSITQTLDLNVMSSYFPLSLSGLNDRNIADVSCVCVLKPTRVQDLWYSTLAEQNS